MKRFFVTALFLLSACSSGPSKSDAEDIGRNGLQAGFDVEVNDLSCEAQNENEYICFVGLELVDGNGNSTPYMARDTTFVKANGIWMSDLKSKISPAPQ